MKSKGWIIMLFSLIFLLKSVSADIITPLSFATIPLIPFIIIIEAFLFWILINKSLKIQVGFWKLILIALLANIITSLLGTFVPIYRFAVENLIWIGIAFVFSVLIEWPVYVYFLRKFEIKKSDLLMVSFIANLATYIPLSLFMVFG